MGPTVWQLGSVRAICRDTGLRQPGRLYSCLYFILKMNSSLRFWMHPLMILLANDATLLCLFTAGSAFHCVLSTVLRRISGIFSACNLYLRFLDWLPLLPGVSQCLVPGDVPAPPQGTMPELGRRSRSEKTSRGAASACWVAGAACFGGLAIGDIFSLPPGPA